MNPKSTTPSARRSDRMLYGIVRRLVRLSNVVITPQRTDHRADGASAPRDATMMSIVAELSALGFVKLPGDFLSTNIKRPPTGSSVNVAIIPGDANGQVLVLKFTDSVVASAELATSSDNQVRLAADPRFSSWCSLIPHVQARGKVGSTTFAIEQFLSSRDGRDDADDPVITSSRIAQALMVIEDFHRLGARLQYVDVTVLSAIVGRNIDILRANTPAGVLRCRARSIERLAQWLRQSLLGHDLEVGWTHGDYHLGNVLIDEVGDHIVGVIDWGRAESDGLTVLDEFTLIVLERAKGVGQEISTFVIELLRDLELPMAERAHFDVLEELLALNAGKSDVDLRCLLMLTWLKHVANNLKNEDPTRSHALWRLRTVDLVLFGAAEIVGY